MSITIQQITDTDRKRQIARDVLEDLTDWFEVPETRAAYIWNAGEWVLLAAEQESEAVGFLCIRETGSATVELAVMGIRRAYHRQGIGRALVLAARVYAASAGYEFLQVKTVEMGRYEDYDLTNQFYLSVGFKPFEVIPEVWDEANPCQIYVMSLKEQKTPLEWILERRSYRGRYRSDTVPREHLRAILEAGLAAPSGCNKQTVSLIAVDDPQLLEKMHAVIDPPVGETAPAMICVLSRHIIAYRDRCFAVQDYSAAIENMLLAIKVLGYESCWFEGHITDTDRIGDKLARILGVPDGYDLVCILPVGIAESAPGMPKKQPFEARAWFNGFR